MFSWSLVCGGCKNSLAQRRLFCQIGIKVRWKRITPNSRLGKEHAGFFVGWCRNARFHESKIILFVGWWCRNATWRELVITSPTPESSGRGKTNDFGTFTFFLRDTWRNRPLVVSSGFPRFFFCVFPYQDHWRGHNGQKTNLSLATGFQKISCEPLTNS